MNKKILFSGILALVFSFTGCDQGTGTSPESVALTTLDFNTDGAGYATVATEAMLAAGSNPKIGYAVVSAEYSVFFGASSWFVPLIRLSAQNHLLPSLVGDMFRPERTGETGIKLNSFRSKLNEIQNSIVELQNQMDGAAIQDLTRRQELDNYLTQITAAAEAAQFYGGNDMSLSKAGMTFLAVDGEITRGPLGKLNNAEIYADVCRGLYSTGNPYLGIKENHKLYNAYLTLAHLILGSGRQWTDGLSACDAYSAFLSKVGFDDAQILEKRRAFILSISDTYEVLKAFLLRAIQYDLDFNKALYEANMEIVDAADTDDDLREEAAKIAGTAMNNYLYVSDTLLDPRAENIGSITYMNALVNAALTKAKAQAWPWL